jgi:hypothetical protein
MWLPFTPLSLKTLSFLSQGREKSTFYLYDLIMNLLNLGSGFEFDELIPKALREIQDQSTTL